MKRLNKGWEFTPVWSEAFLRGEGSAEKVRLPHTVKELPLHYIDEKDYQMVCGYRRRLELPKDLTGKRVFVQLDGAAHIAGLYCNGQLAASHACGYTAFRAEITPFIRPGEDNLIAVRLDTTENPAVPPFGFVIDYLTYGGLYRDAWLDIRSERHIRDVFVHTPELRTASVSVTLDGRGQGGSLLVEILDEASGELLASRELPANEDAVSLELACANAKPWRIESPSLSLCRVTLKDGEGRPCDSQETTFGFRTARFEKDGFYLNGEKVFMRGLNRHQCYPYIGYAAPESLQREDARILKRELQLNAVRTSHYPQSRWFIDQCDREGLLVFTEIPGWQHIGDEKWKEQACENTREMVLEYRNHPSIVVWGVRINESQDDDALYERTNAIAHSLDPSRATSGVRYLEKSSLKEDVYSFNDFSHKGDNPGCRRKRDVMKEEDRALLITEHSGHMFPTKIFDPWRIRQSHALRHARVLNDAMADGEHAGCFGWCMFDYPTHRDFGSGDRVCYHGVMDAFRNPKPAAAVYASQGEEKPVLYVTSPMHIGDYPGDDPGSAWILTNADEVALYKNDEYVTTYRHSDFAALPHGPLKADDTIGCLLETREGFSKKKAAALRRMLIAAGKKGLSNLSLIDKARMGFVMLRCHLGMKEGIDLYGKYIGNWGGEATRWRFDAIKNGQVVQSLVKGQSTALRLVCEASGTLLQEGESYDMAAVRIRIVDEYGCPAVYAQIPVSLKLTGPAHLVGPACVTLEGGSGGTYVKTAGEAGKARLEIACDLTESVSIDFEIRSAAL